MPYQENREKKLERLKRWRNSERGKEIRRRYIEKARLSNRKYKKTERGKINNHMNGRKRNQRLKKQLIDLLGGRCVQCSITDIRMLQVDHINGYGNADRRLHGPAGLIVYYIRHTEEAKTKLQVLCANHHSLKTYLSYEEGQPL